MPAYTQGLAKTRNIAAGAVTNAKLATDSVTEAKIKDGEIINADISATAAIADTKLAQITTASKVSGAAITLLTNLPAGAGVIPSANLPAASVYLAMKKHGLATASTNISFAAAECGVNDAIEIVLMGRRSSGTQIDCSITFAGQSITIFAGGSHDYGRVFAIQSPLDNTECRYFSERSHDGGAYTLAVGGLNIATANWISGAWTLNITPSNGDSQVIYSVIHHKAI